jgi:hypothetical protein
MAQYNYTGARVARSISTDIEQGEITLTLLILIAAKDLTRV